MIIKRLLDKKCLGYSNDFSIAYFVGTAILADNSLASVYGIECEGEYTEWSGSIPYVARQILKADERDDVK